MVTHFWLHLLEMLLFQLRYFLVLQGSSPLIGPALDMHRGKQRAFVKHFFVLFYCVVILSPIT